MNQYFLLILLFFGFCSTVPVKDEALQECGDLLHNDIHKIPGARGEFTNSRCLLKCYSGDVILTSSPIHEGFPCEPEANGVSVFFTVLLNFSLK